MQKRTKIKELIATEPTGQEVVVKGWVRTFRNTQFIAINDGSTINNIQAVLNAGVTDDATMKRITPGSCVGITGKLIASQGKGQKVEVAVTAIEIYGDAESDISKPNS